MNKFTPCKECINSGLYNYEEEPLYYCTMIKNKYYPKLREMYKDCPL